MIPFDLPASLETPPESLLWVGPIPNSGHSSRIQEANQTPLRRLHSWLISVCDLMAHRNDLADWIDRPTKSPVSHAVWVQSNETAYEKERSHVAKLRQVAPETQLLAIRSDRVSARPLLPGQSDYVQVVSILNAAWYLPAWLQVQHSVDKTAPPVAETKSNRRVEIYASDVEIGEACSASLAIEPRDAQPHSVLTSWDDYALGNRRRGGGRVVCVWDDSFVSPFELTQWYQRRKSRPRPDVVGHVWMTHRCNQTQWQEAMEAGAAAVIEKPFPRAVLNAAITHASGHFEESRHARHVPSPTKHT